MVHRYVIPIIIKSISSGHSYCTPSKDVTPVAGTAPPPTCIRGACGPRTADTMVQSAAVTVAATRRGTAHQLTEHVSYPVIESETQEQQRVGALLSD